MTKKQIEDWKRERDIAREISDPKEREIALGKVYDHRDDMMMECIQHQADRVKTSLENDKRLEGEINEIKTALAPCVESDKEWREKKLMARGAKWAIGVVIGLSTVVGSVVAIKICKMIGTLW